MVNLEAHSLELVYVGDPMCSWCWGFAPVVEKIDGAFDIPMRTVVGGLRPGDKAEPIDRIRPMLEHHWSQVAAASGQPFDLGGLDRTDWMYDTLLPDTAIVTMRSAASGETLRFLSTVQRAFYADRVDVTDIDVYPDLVADFPVNPSEFIEALESPEMHAAAEQDFIEAQWLGVTGFPTLLLRDGATTVPLSLGYTTFERVAERINDFIEKNHPEAAAGLVCDIDGEAC
ncbi:MAG: DsbA family protein [Actinomycetota bacterium]|nr:DsbA family protein [Actinomycetota bacterium]